MFQRFNQVSLHHKFGHASMSSYWAMSVLRLLSFSGVMGVAAGKSVCSPTDLGHMKDKANPAVWNATFLQKNFACRLSSYREAQDSLDKSFSPSHFTPEFVLCLKRETSLSEACSTYCFAEEARSSAHTCEESCAKDKTRDDKRCRTCLSTNFSKSRKELQACFEKELFEWPHIGSYGDYTKARQHGVDLITDPNLISYAPFEDVMKTMPAEAQTYVRRCHGNYACIRAEIFSSNGGTTQDKTDTFKHANALLNGAERRLQRHTFAANQIPHIAAPPTVASAYIFV